MYNGNFKDLLSSLKAGIEAGVSEGREMGKPRLMKHPSSIMNIPSLYSLTVLISNNEITKKLGQDLNQEPFDSRTNTPADVLCSLSTQELLIKAGLIGLIKEPVYLKLVAVYECY